MHFCRSRFRIRQSQRQSLGDKLRRQGVETRCGDKVWRQGASAEHTLKPFLNLTLNRHTPPAFSFAFDNDGTNGTQGTNGAQGTEYARRLPYRELVAGWRAGRLGTGASSNFRTLELPNFRTSSRLRASVRKKPAAGAEGDKVDESPEGARHASPGQRPGE
jgi:hypothetical protein